jgi:cation transport regulator ChaC
MTSPQFVFGYGSLLEHSDSAGEPSGQAQLCHLDGYRRRWDIAMDNSRDLPDYKHYLNAADGTRPEVFVAFLNVEPATGYRVNGTLLPVSDADLEELDSRERNYSRVDVTTKIVPPVSGRVWTYVGTPDAKARFERGMREKRAVIDEDYLNHVRAQFAGFGEASLREFEQLTEPPSSPIVRLRRVDH